MKKLSHILQLAELFYKTAMQVFAAEPQGHYMPDDPEEDDSAQGLTGNIQVDADRFDIKDEKLFAQFESLMQAYNALMDLIYIDPNNLSPAAMQEAAQLVDVLNTRYERIMSNPYLNAMDENYSEDFDPGELTAFIQSVVKDAEDKLKTIAGEEVNIDEVIANQYAQEFNQQMVDKGDKSLTYTGNKVQQLLEARRNWFKNLMFIKKVGQSHPQYERYERYIDGRHKSYQNMMSDPARKTAYRERVKERFNKWFKSIPEQKQNLADLIARTDDPKKKLELSKKLDKLEQKEDRLLVRRKKYMDKRKGLWEEKSLSGSIQRLRTKLDTAKSEVAKKIKAKAANDPYFNEYKTAVQNAKNNYDNDPSPENKRALEAAVKGEAEAITRYLNGHEVVVKVRQDISNISNFKDQVISLTKMEGADPTTIQNLISMGQDLISTYGKVYRAPIEAVNEIVTELRKQI